MHSLEGLDLRTEKSGFLNVYGLEFGFDILLPDCGLPPLDWIVNQILAITH